MALFLVGGRVSLNDPAGALDTEAGHPQVWRRGSGGWRCGSPHGRADEGRTRPAECRMPARSSHDRAHRAQPRVRFVTVQAVPALDLDHVTARQAPRELVAV